MYTPIIRAVTLTVASISLSSCSFFTSSDIDPYYPLLTDSVYSDESLALIETNNIVIKALKSNRYVDVSNYQQVNNVAAIVFNEAEASSSVSIADIQTSHFHRMLESIIKQFACEVYASQQLENSVQFCPFQKKNHWMVGFPLPEEHTRVILTGE